MIRWSRARPAVGLGAVLAAVLLGLAGCASAGDGGAVSAGDGTTGPTGPSARLPAEASPGGATPTAPTATPPSTVTATTDVRTLEITVSSGVVSPPPSQVDLGVGETLRLVVTSETGSEIHAHGFEIDAPVPAGQPTSIDLTGETPGVYEVELHDPDLLLLQVAVR